MHSSSNQPVTYSYEYNFNYLLANSAATATVATTNVSHYKNNTMQYICYMHVRNYA